MLKMPRQWQRAYWYRAVTAATVLLIALLLKLHYSQATSDELVWIIKPTALLTQWFSGITFLSEAGYGWVDSDHRYLIAPACAGVNFLIITWCMLAFQGIGHWKAVPALTGWLLACGAMAFGSTLVANGLRIWVSMYLYSTAHIYEDQLDPHTVHRLAGVIIYYLFLCFNSWLVSRMLEKTTAPKKSGQRTPLLLLTPLCWYLIISLGLPLLNQAYQTQPERFLEHAGFVVGTTGVLTLILLSPMGMRRIMNIYKKWSS